MIFNEFWYRPGDRCGGAMPKIVEKPMIFNELCKRPHHPPTHRPSGGEGGVKRQRRAVAVMPKTSKNQWFLMNSTKIIVKQKNFDEFSNKS